MAVLDLTELLRSWENLEFITLEIPKSPAHYSALMEIALHSADPVSWRAAYLVDKIHETRPELIVPFIQRIIGQLEHETSLSKKRHFLKQISLNEIPRNRQSFLYDYSLKTFTSEKGPIAVRVNAMQILYNISEAEPDLKPELLAIIENEMEHHPTAGILSRGKKLAKKLHSQISTPS